MSLDDSQIREFFKNQTIFLTGGSGFLGKILIEKLLRACPDVDRIYVLMRPKKGKTPEQRFDELFSFACFDRLKFENVEVLEKVSLVTGDCQHPAMGLGEQNLDVLRKKATCVIHAAANVKFDQSLREASTNVKATKYLLELAKEMPNLKVFVYVSTAFANCIYSTIKEEFYEPPMKAENLFAIVDGLEEEILDSITPKLLGKWPNTYVYAKCISEDLVKDVGSGLPMVVVRPAIVGSTLEEPMPGWIDNFYGAAGISVAASLGVIKTLHGKRNARAYLVPVDFVANCILASAWRQTKCSTTKIYNYIGCPENILTWGTYSQKLRKFYWSYTPEKAVWYYSFKIRENKLLNDVCVFFLHTLVAYIVDFVLFCFRKPTLAVRNYRRLNKALDLISYFSSRDWSFGIGNVEELWAEMNDADKKFFNFDMKTCDIDAGLRSAVIGGKKYLLKESVDTVSKAQRRLKILFLAHYTVLAFFYYSLYKILCFVLGFLY